MARLVLALCFLTYWSSISYAQDPEIIIKRQKTSMDSVADSLYRIQITKREIDGNYIPKDLFDCFKELDKAMDEEARQSFMAFSDEEVDKKTHWTLGRWMDRHWYLTEGSRLSHYFNKMKVPHPDYMIGIIIQSYHRHLHGKDLQLKEQVEFFRAVWAKKQKERAEQMLNDSDGQH